jgi:superfamily II DNA helicase RecQ
MFILVKSEALPSHVNVMCLTATSTMQTFDAVFSRLSSCDPALISLSPNRSNIFYVVKEMPKMTDFCSNFAAELECQSVAYPKTIMFRRRYLNCAAMYHNL